MKNEKIVIIGTCSTGLNAAKIAVMNMGHTNVVVSTISEEKERGITITNKPEPFLIKPYEILSEIGFESNPRKNKKKQFTPQPWRNNRKK